MKKLLLLFAMAALMSACVKQPEPPKQIRFSILGDSYSTFEGYVHPETNDVYPFDSIGVTNVEQMWWHKVAVEKGWILDVNNSFSGSLVCNYNYAYYYGPHSFLHRMDDLGQPDVFSFSGLPTMLAPMMVTMCQLYRLAMMFFQIGLKINFALSVRLCPISLKICNKGIPMLSCISFST